MLDKEVQPMKHEVVEVKGRNYSVHYEVQITEIQIGRCHVCGQNREVAHFRVGIVDEIVKEFSDPIPLKCPRANMVLQALRNLRQQRIEGKDICDECLENYVLDLENE